MRIERHPILREFPRGEPVTLLVNGKRIPAFSGETVAAALWAAGIRAFRITKKLHEPRGPFCFIGRCTDCEVEIDGDPHVKACITPVRDGMVIKLPEAEN
jgi:predicted molibdopterin-dependent oxidoreductase YjgC